MVHQEKMEGMGGTGWLWWDPLGHQERMDWMEQMEQMAEMEKMGGTEEMGLR